MRQVEDDGRATLIKLNSPFTKDQGPAVSGVWSVVAPSIMEIARERIPAFKSGLIGSGIYYHEVKARDDLSNINTTIAIAIISNILHLAVQKAVDPDEIHDDLTTLGTQFENELALNRAIQGLRGMDGTIESMRNYYLSHVAKHKLFDQSCTVDVARPRLLQAATSANAVDISSSHCLRLSIDKDRAASLIRALEGSMRNPYVLT